MNRVYRNPLFDRIFHLPADRVAWLWLLVGLLALPFTFYQTVIPLAAWLAPIFLLRFSRAARRAWIALALIFLAYAVGILIGLRGSDPSDSVSFIFGLIVFPLIRGLMYTLPYAADRFIGSRSGVWARLLVFPLAFTSVDWLLSLLAITNTTGSPAYSQYDNLALLQVLSITGMWGVTFLIMWCATTVNALWEHQFDWRPVRFPVGAFAAILLAIVLFGSARLAFSAPTAPTVTAATITIESAVSANASSAFDANFMQSLTNDVLRAAVRQKIQPTVDQMIARTETALRGGAKIVTWEEGAGTVLEEDKQPALDRVAALAKQYGADIQVSLSVILRAQQQRFLRNQSILVDPTGAIRWTYDKSYPVYINEWYILIAGTRTLPVADTQYGRLSTAICNDLHFLPLLRQAGANGVDILLAPYHDVHPWETEDAVVATYRAIENGFSLVRPTGKGFSTITDYQGRMLAMQNYFTNNTGILLTTIPTRGVMTIYSRIGDLFAYLCVAGWAVLIILTFARRKQPALTRQHQAA